MKRTATRNVLIASLFLALTGLGLWLGETSGVLQDSDATQTTAGESTAQEARNAEALLKHSRATDEIRTFGMEQELTVEMSPAQGPSTASNILVRGQFDEQLVSTTAGIFTYQYHFRDVEFESAHSQGQSSLPEDEVNNIVQSLNKTVLILKTDALHSKANWSVSQGTTLESFNLLRSVVLSGFVFLPAEKELKEWLSTEEDSTGLFTQTNKLVSLADGKAKLEKEPKTVRVLSSAEAETGLNEGDANLQTVVVLPSSVTRIDFDATAGHLIQSEQRWSLRAQTAGLMATTNVRTRVDFISKRKAPAQPQQSAENSTGSNSLSGPSFQSEYELLNTHSASLKKKVAAQKLGGENWASLRSRLMSPDFHKDGAARAQFFEQLAALLLLQPEMCTTVAEEIAQLNKSDPDYKSKLSLLAGVFTTQDSAESEAALVALAERLKDDAPALMQVVPALAAHRNPSERTRDALLNFYTSATDEGVKSAATLAMGTFAFRAQNARPDLTRETVERLKQDFDSASSIDKKVTLSGALGNVGANETLESVKSLFSASQDVSLKRSALFDLRFVSDPAVDSFLNTVVSDATVDPDLLVQSMRVMRMRPPLKMHLQSSLTQFRNKTARATVRSEALSTLAHMIPVEPSEVRNALAEAAKDENTQIAKQAEQIIAKLNQAQ
ncbi:MAG: hypothetical protein RIR26_2358 [Pseudomonadota bacterium]